MEGLGSQSPSAPWSRVWFLLGPRRYSQEVIYREKNCNLLKWAGLIQPFGPPWVLPFWGLFDPTSRITPVGRAPWTHQVMRAQWKMRSHCSQKQPWSLIGHPPLSGHCLCPSNSKCCPGTTAVWTLGVPEALVAAPTLACPVRQSALPTVSTFLCQSPPWAHLAVQDWATCLLLAARGPGKVSGLSGSYSGQNLSSVSQPGMKRTVCAG